MRALIRSLPLALAAALLVLFAVACSGGGSGDTTSSEPADRPAGQTDGGTVADDDADDDSDAFVSAAPIEVLSASAESFDSDVESFQSVMEFSMSAGSFDVEMTAEMAFQAPDQMHMTMDTTGLGSSELLILGGDFYMKIPQMGWVVFSAEDLTGDSGLAEFGLDAEALQDAFGSHSFVDYQAIVESLGGEIEDLGDETIDGATYRHYRGSLEFADLTAAFSDAFGAADVVDVADVSGPVTFDVWVDPETFLPHKGVVGGEFAFGTERMLFDASMLFFGYNEAVDIPAPPQDAVSFADLFAGLTEGFEGLE